VLVADGRPLLLQWLSRPELETARVYDNVLNMWQVC
jgi:hypothetical protein